MVARSTDRRTYKRMLLYDDSYYGGLRGFVVSHTQARVPSVSEILVDDLVPGGSSSKI